MNIQYSNIYTSPPFHIIYLLLFILFFSSPEVSAQNQKPLSIQLIVPISSPDGQREISLERYHRLHIIISNDSPLPQRIWKDWNTWGYFNLTLEWKVGPKVFQIKRKAPRSWDGDFPDFWVINPKESVVIEVDMSTANWDGFPDLYGEEYNVTLQAFYENKTDPLAKEFGVWVGKLESEVLEVVFK